MGQDTAASVRIITAAELVWSGIRRRHPDVPAVVTTFASGMTGRRYEKLGHFAAGRWEHRDSGRLPELFIGGEGLRRGPRDVLGTLIHEAAHGAAHTRGERDTSRQGRYHNGVFRRIGEDFGLTLTRTDTLGWSVTSVPDETAAEYAAELDTLAEALTVYRRTDGGQRGGRPPSNNGVALSCSCGRRIRVAPSVAEQGPISCGLCGAAFTR